MHDVIVKQIQKRKRKLISWTDEAEEIAVRLAFERGYYPEKKNGGVSKLILDMLLKEAEKKEDSAGGARSRRASGLTPSTRANAPRT